MEPFVSVKMVRDKETKNMIRYSEADEDPLVGSLYVSKRAIEQAFGEAPFEIEVRVTNIDRPIEIG